MRKQLPILLCLPLLFSTCKKTDDTNTISGNNNVNNNGTPLLTYVPDDNFENYLEANGMGDGILLNDTILFQNVYQVTNLSVNNLNIADLTGIEDFTALTTLECYLNQLTSLDVSNNTALHQVHLTNCQQLTSLDMSSNTALTFLEYNGNVLASLDLRNGNNINMNISTEDNPNLTCIDVDDDVWSIANWTVVNGNIDGLDEIKVPVKAKKIETKKQKNKGNTAFDFDQISLENP